MRLRPTLLARLVVPCKCSIVQVFVICYMMSKPLDNPRPPFLARLLYSFQPSPNQTNVSTRRGVVHYRPSTIPSSSSIHSPPPRLPRLPTSRHLLVRPPHLIVLPHKMPPPLLRRQMLHKQLPRVLAHEPANKPRIPELRRDAQVLAAAHQRVGLAPFSSRRDAVGVEVRLLAAGEGDESVNTIFCQPCTFTLPCLLSFFSNEGVAKLTVLRKQARTPS